MSSSSAPRQRRSSTSHQRRNKSEDTTAAKGPYTPIFQPPGYPYKIALPHAPKPGETPFPAHLPSVLKNSPDSRPGSLRSSASSSPADAPPPLPPKDHHRARVVSAPPPPRTTTTAARIHPLLAYTGQAPQLTFDLRAPPTHITLSSTRAPITHAHRAQPCAVSALRVRSPAAPWVLDVPAGASLGAVLDALHALFAVPLAHAEWAALAPQRQAGVAAAYQQRSAARGDAHVGVRRVDCLGAAVLFAGLAPTSDPMTYTLVLARA